LDDKISFIEAVFCDYYALAENFRLSQSKQPNFDYPQMQIYHTKYHKNIFLHVYANKLLNIPKNPFNA